MQKQLKSVHSPSKHARGWRVRVEFSDGTRQDKYRRQRGAADALHAELKAQIPQAGPVDISDGLTLEAYWPRVLRQLMTSALREEDREARRQLESLIRAASQAAQASARYVKIDQMRQDVDDLKRAIADINSIREAQGNLG